MSGPSSARRRAIDFIVLVTLVAVLILVARLGQPRVPAVANGETPTAWNFLVIVVDTLRYDATTMGGAQSTPFLQRVARRGVSFSNAYTTHDSTPPSHFSLLTGMREGLAQINDRPDMSVPFQLRARGYSTFGVAANGNLSQEAMPALAGFSRYVCLYDEWLAMRPEERAARLPAINARLRQYGARELEWNQAQMFCSGREALGRFRGMLHAASEPFFGFVNIIEPHDPYLPSRDALGNEPVWARGVDADLRFRPLGFPLANPASVGDAALRASILKRIALGANPASLSDDLPPHAIQTYRHRYLASARDADDVVRSIFMALEERNVLDRTWVIIVSDHGESFGERGFMLHSLSDQGDPEATLHVPMIWAPPARVPRGATIDGRVSLADVAGTIYDLAGIDWAPLRARAPEEFGRSLIEYLAVERDAEAIASPATLGHDVGDAQRQRMREQALRRLRALGYIR